MPDINYPVANKTTVEGALAELADGTGINDGAITPAKTSFIGLYSSITRI